MNDTRINQFRKERNLSVEQLGSILGVSISYIEKLCYGTRVPSANILARLKKCFPDVDLNFFYDQIAQNVR